MAYTIKPGVALESGEFIPADELNKTVCLMRENEPNGNTTTGPQPAVAAAPEMATTVTREMIGAAHDVMLAKGDFILSASLLERIYLAMVQASPLVAIRADQLLATSAARNRSNDDNGRANG